MSEIVEDIWIGDQMDRKKSSDFLTKYLLAEDSVKVLNVNSPWGAGKSFFLKRWAAELSKDHVCIFFNAWESDFGTEPLVALIACIEQQTKDGVALDSSETGKAIIDVGTDLIRAATPLIAKGLLKKFVGLEYDEIAGDLAGEAAKTVIGKLVKEQSDSENKVRDFKEAVKACLAQAALNENKKPPAFIFIDELDRCRPTYAIELLERVKHFFELEECKFIIASDSMQLAHSIRAVYGEKFYSERYLSRFFDSEFRLDNRDIFKVVQANMFRVDGMTIKIRVSGIPMPRGYASDRENLVYPQADTLKCDIQGYTPQCLVIVGMAKFFNLELREVLKCISQIKSINAYMPGMGFDFFLVAFLVFAKSSDEGLYRSVFERDTGGAEFLRIASANYSPMTFHLGVEVVSVVTIISYYIYIFNLGDREARNLIHGDNGWREETLYHIYDKQDLLGKYRDIIELAHRLS